MSLFRFSCALGLLCVAACAAAAPNRDAEKSAQPSPEAMHERLAQISQDPASLTAAIQRGQRDASVCRHCHGIGGNSMMSDVPNLASQNAAYLLEQMNKFVLGQRKSSPFMEGMIKALTPDERINIALFLSQQPVARKPASMTAQDGAGRKLYGQVCFHCHGENGTGSRRIPRLAGQQTQYLEDSLKRYRSGSGERTDPRMAVFTRNLTDTDIRHLAAYLSTLHP
ncbi:MAG: c-type cytochrome [Thiobacillus sp.]|jgi:cytochrome c553|uniref:c-type cytochrome n=1 Tax=Thiobacillus sp. TaxID=924 RepID=UPI002895DFA9|nr:c-type cytochrome [Thiobacillus sp.]MDT3707127.1 c-type cytochrome [Thiobacillus sp.]